MSIFDWFKNRSEQLDPNHPLAELIQFGCDKAVALTNPQLKLLRDWRQRLVPAVAGSIDFLRAQVAMLPAAHALAPAHWASDPALRAFFATPRDIESVLAGSESLHALFDQYPELAEACVVLGMACQEQKGFGMALQGQTIQRDVAQVTVNFSDYKIRLCERDEALLRRVIGVEVFEYLVGQALAEIGALRSERQELQRDCALIRTRLRLLQQHGSGLASMLGDVPAAESEQASLTAELLENERQLKEIGASHTALATEIECLREVLAQPQNYLHLEPKRLRLSTMNVVLDPASTEQAADVEFAIIEGRGHAPVRRAFILARVARTDLPPPQRFDLQNAIRYL